MNTKIICCFFAFVVLSSACDLLNVDKNSLSGDQSEMGEVGVTLSSTSATIAGISSISGTVTALENGISTYSGSAVITNSTIKNILANHPQTNINGDNVTVDNIKFKVTTDGIEAVHGLEQGIIVRYNAKVGDKYKLKNGQSREVVSRSSTDDYSYGFFLIKVIKVEETPNKFGVKKITYWANHRFGLVGIEFTYDDDSTTKFPVYCSAENQ